MNRRQFLAGSSAVAVAATLPAAGLSVGGVPIVFDAPSRDLVWIIESNPSGPSWVATMIYGNDEWLPVEFSGFVPAWSCDSEGA